MISGKKIKMKVKKSKKDKQVSRRMCPRSFRMACAVSYALLRFHSGTKTAPNCLSSSTPPCDDSVGCWVSAPARTRQRSSREQKWKGLQSTSGKLRARRAEGAAFGELSPSLSTTTQTAKLFSLVSYLCSVGCVDVEQCRP